MHRWTEGRSSSNGAADGPAPPETAEVPVCGCAADGDGAANKPAPSLAGSDSGDTADLNGAADKPAPFPAPTGSAGTAAKLALSPFSLS